LKPAGTGYREYHPPGLTAREDQNMSRKARDLRPSPAIIVAIVALVAAVAGTAVAGPGADTSVSKKKTKQIAKKQVNKLAPGIANDEITERAPGLTVGTANQLANVTYVKGPETTVPADANTYLLGGAICPEGSTVVGGGLTGSFLFRVAESYATAANGTDPGRQGWTVRVQNTFGGGGAADGRAFAICVGAAATSGTWP
jgi:hypothetical protein